MFKRVLSWLAVIGLIVGSAWLGHQPISEEPAAMASVHAQEPGYAARDAELTETGDDGRPLYRLNANTIHQQPEDGSVQLHQVRMAYRAENSSQWTLTAEQGALRENNEHIELTGDVRVIGVVPGGSDLAQIRTDRLSFNTQTEMVDTRDAVTLLWGSRELQGIGLTASLKDREVTLESAVHGRFTP